jgi:hypothetical protein
MFKSIAKTILTTAVFAAMLSADEQSSIGQDVKLPQMIRAAIITANKTLMKEYTPIKYIKGDLNLDGIDDAIVVLAKKNEPNWFNGTADDWENPPKRPMLLLLGNKKGTYTLAARNDNVVYSAMERRDTLDDNIAIGNGYFTSEGAGVDGVDYATIKEIFTFKYDTEKKEWFLYDINLHNEVKKYCPPREVSQTEDEDDAYDDTDETKEAEQYDDGQQDDEYDTDAERCDEGQLIGVVDEYIRKTVKDFGVVPFGEFDINLY